MKDRSEIIEEFVEVVFLVFGALCLFFSGNLVSVDYRLSFILLVIGILSLMIRGEYDKDEVGEE